LWKLTDDARRLLSERDFSNHFLKVRRGKIDMLAMSAVVPK
jgi:hypothetical protein